VYSITEVAALCGISRGRFYDLIKSGVMPHPVYDLATRRPMYESDMAALCVRVRETNVGFDGRYVLFYPRRKASKVTTAPDRQTARRPSAPDPLMREMIEALKAMNLKADDNEIVAAVTQRCPQGLAESTFETDLRAIFDHLRRRQGG
jgi:hypothetical protein